MSACTLAPRTSLLPAAAPPSPCAHSLADSPATPSMVARAKSWPEPASTARTGGSTSPGTCGSRNCGRGRLRSASRTWQTNPPVPRRDDAPCAHLTGSRGPDATENALAAGARESAAASAMQAASTQREPVPTHALRAGRRVALMHAPSPSSQPPSPPSVERRRALAAIRSTAAAGASIVGTPCCVRGGHRMPGPNRLTPSSDLRPLARPRVLLCPAFIRLSAYTALLRAVRP